MREKEIKIERSRKEKERTIGIVDCRPPRSHGVFVCISDPRSFLDSPNFSRSACDPQLCHAEGPNTHRDCDILCGSGGLLWLIGGGGGGSCACNRVVETVVIITRAVEGQRRQNRLGREGDDFSRTRWSSSSTVCEDRGRDGGSAVEKGLLLPAWGARMGSRGEDGSALMMLC